VKLLSVNIILQLIRKMNKRSFFRRLNGIAMLFIAGMVSAQTAGVLYDPEPPVDSAYVRVLVPTKTGNFDIVVDGRERIKKLSAGDASEYMVLTAGSHTLAIQSAGKSGPLISTSFEVVAGRSVTMAFPDLKPNSSPIVFQDKSNTNKLKALLLVYSLDSKAGAVDLLTADASSKVFTNLVYGNSKGLLVNPISVDLIATAAGQKTPKAKVSLSMSQGGSYSIFLLPGEGGKLVVKSAQSKTERYTGK
jgi:hypothetical protein